MLRMSSTWHNPAGASFWGLPVFLLFLRKLGKTKKTYGNRSKTKQTLIAFFAKTEETRAPASRKPKKLEKTKLLHSKQRSVRSKQCSVRSKQGLRTRNSVLCVRNRENARTPSFCLRNNALYARINCSVHWKQRSVCSKQRFVRSKSKN